MSTTIDEHGHSSPELQLWTVRSANVRRKWGIPESAFDALLPPPDMSTYPPEVFLVLVPMLPRRGRRGALVETMAESVALMSMFGMRRVAVSDVRAFPAAHIPKPGSLSWQIVSVSAAKNIGVLGSDKEPTSPLAALALLWQHFSWTQRTLLEPTTAMAGFWIPGCAARINGDAGRMFFAPSQKKRDHLTVHTAGREDTLKYAYVPTFRERA